VLKLKAVVWVTPKSVKRITDNASSYPNRNIQYFIGGITYVRLFQNLMSAQIHQKVFLKPQNGKNRFQKCVL
jgi:hypothetical protein